MLPGKFKPERLTRRLGSIKARKPTPRLRGRTTSVKVMLPWNFKPERTTRSLGSIKARKSTPSLRGRTTSVKVMLPWCFKPERLTRSLGSIKARKPSPRLRGRTTSVGVLLPWAYYFRGRATSVGVLSLWAVLHGHTNSMVFVETKSGLPFYCREASVVEYHPVQHPVQQKWKDDKVILFCKNSRLTIVLIYYILIHPLMLEDYAATTINKDGRSTEGSGVKLFGLQGFLMRREPLIEYIPSIKKLYAHRWAT